MATTNHFIKVVTNIQQHLTLVSFVFQLASKGHVLKDTHCADSEGIDFVFSHFQTGLVVCYLRMKKPQLALVRAHR